MDHLPPVSENNPVFNKRDSFYELFSEKKTQLIVLMQESENVNRNALCQHFAAINEHFEACQEILQSWLPSLPAYNAKKYQQELNQLKVAFQSQQSALLPKKKLFFGQRSNFALSSNSVVTQHANDTVDSVNLSTSLEFEVSQREGQNITISKQELHKKQVTLRDLSNCKIFLPALMSALHLVKICNCTVLAGPVASSVLVEDSHECTMALAGQQIRVHNSDHCDVYVLVSSSMILENCTAIRVAPYSWTYSSQQEDLAMAGLDSTQNNYLSIKDFDWPSTAHPSPNWFVLGEQERSTFLPDCSE